VLGASQLVRWLKKQPPIPEPAQMAAVASTVRDEATWSNEPTPLPDITGFDALRREVGRAQRTRLTWVVAALIVILGITAPAAFGLFERELGG
jgi:hypothetical protein